MSEGQPETQFAVAVARSMVPVANRNKEDRREVGAVGQLEQRVGRDQNDGGNPIPATVPSNLDSRSDLNSDACRQVRVRAERMTIFSNLCRSGRPASPR